MYMRTKHTSTLQHTNEHIYIDGMNAGLNAPISKGRLIIIMHPGNDNGFILTALLTVKMASFQMIY